MGETVAKVQLLGTLGCSLCDEASRFVVPEAQRAGWCFEEVDIALDDALLERFGERIPVLLCSDRSTQLEWPFDQGAVRMFLQRD